MLYCPITYEHINSSERYSPKGLRLLSPKLQSLSPLPFSAQEQRDEAILRASKLSIQGVQPKLSAALNHQLHSFEFVDKGGDYILKPESQMWPELPANEAISMTLAKLFGIEVPLHGLLFCQDESLTYFVKRFDRDKKKKIAVEDFAQLSSSSRETKYDSSIEKIIKIIEQFTTFPRIEYIKLFKRVLFNFIIGNEDMHLKNYSLIERDGQWQLAPAYDFLNTSIAIKTPIEESALPLNGRKHKLRREDFIDYLAISRLSLPAKHIQIILGELKAFKPTIETYINRSYLSPAMREAYVALVNERLARFD